MGRDGFSDIVLYLFCSFVQTVVFHKMRRLLSYGHGLDTKERYGEQRVCCSWAFDRRCDDGLVLDFSSRCDNGNGLVLGFSSSSKPTKDTKTKMILRWTGQGTPEKYSNDPQHVPYLYPHQRLPLPQIRRRAHNLFKLCSASNKGRFNFSVPVLY